MRDIAENQIRYVAVAAAIVLCGLMAGCQTPAPDDQSQMPWNTPQDWESSPMMPGFGDRY